jgi:uncharacterized membrane protein YgaE (UPF0421/DUF939 family)
MPAEQPAPGSDQVFRRTVRRGRLTVRERFAALRGSLWPIALTATTAAAAYVLAGLLLGGPAPLFASIATVICISATEGERGRRAFELVGGVIVGITIADLLVAVTGTGPVQIIVLVALAMAAAVLVGGGGVMVPEAAISAIIIASLEPTEGISPQRFLEACIGGSTALAVNFLLFPPDPLVRVNRAAQQVLSQVGSAVEQTADALAGANLDAAERALFTAREADRYIAAFDSALEEGRETARFSVFRRGAMPQLESYRHGAAHVDRASNNVRVLARAAVRHIRGGGAPSPGLAEAVRDLARAVWALAGALDDPGELESTRRFAQRAAQRASDVLHEQGGVSVNLMVGQVQSTAADLLRAAGEEISGAADMPTDELLAAEAERSSDRS